MRKQLPYLCEYTPLGLAQRPIIALYMLWDLLADEPFYVGQTSHPERRLYEHLSDERNWNKWSRVRRIRFIDPEAVTLRVIKWTTIVDAENDEHELIMSIGSKYQLTNGNAPIPEPL